MDEAIFSLIPYLTKGWFKKGSRPIKKIINNPHQKWCSFGALFRGKIITGFSKRINSSRFLAFIKRLRSQHKKLCIIIDNARWHLTKRVLHYAESAGIKIIRILAYSPELNPIEQYWKNVKTWIGQRPFCTLPQLKAQLQSAYRRKDLIPGLAGY